MGTRTRYSPEEIERGLTALVLAGSSSQASEITGIDDATLRTWKSKHRDNYDRLAKDLESQVVDKIAAEAENLAIRIAEVEAKIIAGLDDAAIKTLDAKDMASTLRNLSTSKALQIDKLSSPLRERPSHVQQDSGEHLLTSIARLLGKPIPVTNEAEPQHIETSAVPLSTGSDDPNAPELDTAG